MPALQLPTSFTCGKEGLKIDGTTFHAGDTVSAAVAKKVGKSHIPTPTTMAGAARRAL